MKKYKDIAFEEYKKVLNQVLKNTEININNLISNKQSYQPWERDLIEKYMS